MAFLRSRHTHRSRRHLAALVALFALGAPAAEGQSSLEYQVKAAFLYNFVNFITWPASAFAAPSDALRVCVFGADPFGPVLDRTMEGGVAGTRPILVQRIRDAAAASGCDVVFVPRGAATRTDEVLRAVDGRPVLTVGESPDFLAKGGMINFVLEGGKVRFDVNVPAASARGLSLGSRLLRVARQTIGTEPGG